MQVFLDLQTPFGATVGPGPVAEVVYIRSVDRMDRAGEWYCEIPALAPRANEVKAKRVARAYGLDPQTGEVVLFMGEIEEITLLAQRDQTPMLGIRGNDQMRELTLTTIPYGTSYTESREIPLRLIADFATVDQLPGAWTLTGADETRRELSLEINGDNVLEALITLAETSGEHFRRGSGERELYWLGTVADLETTGLTAINAPHRSFAQTGAAGADNVCRIVDLDQTIDAWQLYNRIVAYGAAQDDAAPATMEQATLWPDGSTMQPSRDNRATLGGQVWRLLKDENVLVNEASIAEYGPRTKTVTFNELRTDENTTVAQTSNMVLQAAYNWLRTRVEPAEYYTITLVDLDRRLLPGQTIRIQARWERDGMLPIAIERELYILEAVNETVARGGTFTVQVTASTVDRWRTTEHDIILGSALGNASSAASIVGIGHTHSGYAAIDHTHADGGWTSGLHTHPEYAASTHAHSSLLPKAGGIMTGDIVLSKGNASIFPDSQVGAGESGSSVGRGNRRFGAGYIRDVFTNLVRPFSFQPGQDNNFSENRGLRLTDHTNFRGIVIRNGKVWVGPQLDNKQALSMLHVDGDLGLQRVETPPTNADANVAKLYYNGGDVISVLMPNGQTLYFQLSKTPKTPTD